MRKPIFVLVIPRFEDIFHSYFAGEVSKGVNLAASRLNVDILIHIVDRRDHAKWLDPSLVNRKNVDGILFADIDNDIEIAKAAIRRGMPVIVLNNILQEPINFVAIDNYKAAFHAVEYMINAGHTKIATIAGDLSTQAGAARLRGYLQALEKHKIKASKTYVKQGDFLRTPARQAAEQLLRMKDRPTAIFAASDVMALEVVDVAQQKGLKIPKDFSLMGFDDNPLIRDSAVTLATVRQPLVEMARLGLEYLFSISRGKAKLPVKQILDAQVVKASSVGSL